MVNVTVIVPCHEGGGPQHLVLADPSWQTALSELTRP